MGASLTVEPDPMSTEMKYNKNDVEWPKLQQ